MPGSRSLRPRGALAGSLLIAFLGGGGLSVLLFALLLASASQGSACEHPAAPLGAGQGGLAPGSSRVVGATEYGGPGDPGSGRFGARGDDLERHPDSYAELGGRTWGAAAALGGLPYLAPLLISWGGHTVLAFKRDFGLGGPPVAGRPRAVDLWWRLAARLGVPYEHGAWSGAVRVARPAADGAAAVLGDAGGAVAPGGCASDAPLSTVPGDRAQLRGDGHAAAPAGAPPAVLRIIAAGNAIAGRPYVYGGGHGLSLSELSPVYDCSSSVEHLLYAGGLVSAGYTVASSALERFGLPGPGRWVTLYANPEHVFMYVAGLRWDTHDAAGAGDGAPGIGWHPLVRDAGAFVARHPPGL